MRNDDDDNDDNDDNDDDDDVTKFKGIKALSPSLSHSLSQGSD